MTVGSSDSVEYSGGFARKTSKRSIDFNWRLRDSSGPSELAVPLRDDAGPFMISVYLTKR